MSFFGVILSFSVNSVLYLINCVLLGMYFVDPNQGSPKDAIEVFCDMSTRQTCVLPKPSSVRVKNPVSSLRIQQSFTVIFILCIFANNAIFHNKVKKLDYIHREVVLSFMDQKLPH